MWEEVGFKREEVNEVEITVLIISEETSTAWNRFSGRGESEVDNGE
jgi:hypothetical protein